MERNGISEAVPPQALFNATHIQLSLAEFLPRIARLRFTEHCITTYFDIWTI
jgi:hypothetical protein